MGALMYVVLGRTVNEHDGRIVSMKTDCSQVLPTYRDGDYFGSEVRNKAEMKEALTFVCFNSMPQASLMDVRIPGMGSNFSM